MADRVVTPSGYLVDLFARYGIRAHAIFNIVDSSRFHYRLRQKLRPVFLTNRGLEPLYNVECVLRAFAIIQERYPEAILTVAHDGSCRRRLEDLTAALKLRNVRFIGCVSQAEMPGLYDAADIYMMSPNIDNMPGSLLECYAAGVPVVATKAGGIPYIARDGSTALLVELNDHEAMARAAFRLIEEDGLAQRLAAAARDECGKYAWPAVRESWLAVYSELRAAR
jgi:glycosyltransferase involved in cell wall biosynthesis